MANKFNPNDPHDATFKTADEILGPAQRAGVKAVEQALGTVVPDLDKDKIRILQERIKSLEDEKASLVEHNDTLKRRLDGAMYATSRLVIHMALSNNKGISPFLRELDLRDID